MASRVASASIMLASVIVQPGRLSRYSTAGSATKPAPRINTENAAVEGRVSFDNVEEDDDVVAVVVAVVEEEEDEFDAATVFACVLIAAVAEAAADDVDAA